VRVLVIEKLKRLSRALKRGLEDQGFAVDVACHEKEGNAKARTAGYQVIVLNLMLSQGDGLSLLQQWRRAGITAHVVVLTARGTMANAARCLDLGADDYLTIPFDPEELFARLRAWRRRDQSAKEHTLRIHDLEINTAARIVKRRGQYIQLTPREYALLEVLAQRRGKVVSRAMIWNNLYDEHDANTSNVIDVYIRFLRQKIDKGFEPPLILTRWGKGYLLRGDEP
jgi:DNA-binding response OmpR family regulator